MANPSENVRDARLRWFGHVESKTKEDIVMRVSLEGRRRRGRPRKVWMDNIDSPHALI